MNIKFVIQRYFWIVLLAFLGACGKQDIAVPTETPIPMVASPTSLPTSTFIPVTVTPSPLPTQPILPIITPDSIQIERWNEYEDALAKTLFFSHFRPEEVVCEWEILGRTDQEVYVWALCASIYSAGPTQVSIPAVIHIGKDGSVQSAEVPGAGTDYGTDIRRMFPTDVQERIFIQPIAYYGSEAYWRAIKQTDRLRWRRGHPDEPPWIVFSALAIQPTQPAIPMITPNPIQVENWREYQTALARELAYLHQEEAICEWELLGRSGNEIYVWAICGEIGSNRVGLENIAIIYVSNDGSVQKALVQGIDIPRMLSLDAQEKYFDGLIHFQELVDHLRWRQSHPEEPPLIVLNATPKP